MRSHLVVGTILALGLGVLPGAAAAAPAAAPAVAPVYPEVGAGTHLVDQDAALAGMSDPDWYRANIPFLDVPDQQVEDVYYYRWRTYKEHLRYTNPTDGWTSTEFLDCCGYAAPYQAINAAAGHQITEGRWLRDQSYGDDLVDFWLTGPGAGPKPATEDVNPSTTDWAHEYSFWLASAAYGRSRVTGRTRELAAMLPALKKQWHGWDGQYNPTLGLYWSVPVWDAMELSASSYQSSDPYHGGAGYRPTLNSYQYGDAVAISEIAARVGDRRTAAEYAAKASALKAAMAKHLWDPEREFYLHVARDDNSGLTRLDTREEIGFVPWAFDAAPAGYEAGWKQLFDPQGFASAFGPTTAERRAPGFLQDAAGCCRWNGPSWPFATSQTLTGMANLLDDYPSQDVVSAEQYAAQLHTYAATQYRDGVPYVAEAHSPDEPRWVYDGGNHSEDYNHSTFTDLVINGLIGLRPADGQTLPVKPLVPASWDHFALENVPYHGHNVTVAYDRDGSHYGFGTGMRVFLDGAQVASRPTVGPVDVPVPDTKAPRPAAHLVNDAANPLRTGYPKPIASYTWVADDAWNALDGKVFFDEVPENTRWTNYASSNPQDWYGVDFGTPTAVSDVRWYGYDDGGGVRPAADYRVQAMVDGTWQDVPDQQRDAAAPVGNGLNRITFRTVTTSALRLLFTNPYGAFVGVTELASWSTSDPTASLSASACTPGSAAAITVDGPTVVKLTMTDEGRTSLFGVRLGLTVPSGWTVSAPSSVPVLRAGESVTRSVTVTPPAGLEPGTQVAAVVTASYRGATGPSSTHTGVPLRIAFPVGPTEAVGSWAFEEGSGTVAHDATGAHDLTVSGTADWVAGHPGGALAYDGSTSAATSGPVVDTAGSFTVGAWVRLGQSGGFQTAVAQDGPTTSGFFLQYVGGDDTFAFATERGRALADVAPEVGRWYHLVGVHDANAGTYTLYVDGKAQSRIWRQSTAEPTSGPFTVGRARAGGGPVDFWHGAVDSVQAWNRALGAAEVSGLDSGG